MEIGVSVEKFEAMEKILTDSGVIIPALVTLALKTMRERGLHWERNSGEEMDAGMIAPFRR